MHNARHPAKCFPWMRLLLGIGIGACAGALLGLSNSCVDGTCPLTATWWRGALYGGSVGTLITLTLSWMK